jgi:hypothetical protein
MGNQKLPINDAPYYNADPVANALDPADAYNCYFEPSPGLGFVTRCRPGLHLFADTATGAQGDGLFYWEDAGLVLAVSGGKLFSVSSAGACTDMTTDALVSGTPAIFAAGQNTDSTPYLYVANGKLAKLESATATTAYPLDANTPNPCTHVAWINSRYIANIGSSNKWCFTDTNPLTGLIENDYWSASENPLSCDAKGDNLDAIFAAWQDIYAWGSGGCEVWQDDGVTPFSPIPSAFAEIGLEAKYSIVFANNTVFAVCVVDGKRCVVSVEGRSPQIISEPIANVLMGMSTVSDAVGFLVNVSGMTLYVLQFPTAGQTWAWDFKNKTWSRWSTYDSAENEHDQFIGMYSCYVKDWNKTLMQSRVDGKIYVVSRDYHDDEGIELRVVRRTPWLDWGEGSKMKRSLALSVRYKRGHVAAGVLSVRWADNGSDTWSPYVELPLSPMGDRFFSYELKQMGTYITRRYEFSMTDDAEMVLVSATENVIGLLR